MPSNHKPVLSILVDGDKRDRFSSLCRRSGRPMSYAINQFIDRCLESGSIDCSPDYLGGDPDVDRLLETLGHVRSGLKRLGKERVKQDLPTETENFDGTAEADGECYEPEKDPELSWMYEDIEDLPIEPPIANSEPRAESDRERWLREYEEHYGRSSQRS